MISVPFNKPVQFENHIEVLRESLQSPSLVGNGPFTKKVEQSLETRMGKHVRLVTSATHALEMMALLTGISPGDEVIVPSFTFVSAANAFVLRGAHLRFADNDGYGNILPSEVERLMSKKTKGVMAMDYAGGSADLDVIREICEKNSVPLFEDAAQAIGARYKGRPLGTVGTLGCFSFHDTKNVTSGEGGALIFGEDRFLERAEIIREKGTNRSQFLQGLVDKYTWVDIGSSYVLSELNVAYLHPQIERLEEVNGKREKNYRAYQRELASDFERRDIKILATPSYNESNYHMFAVVFPKTELRGQFIAYMKSKGITCPFHYVSLHLSPFGSSFYSEKPETLPGCEKLSQCLVRLPLYYNMTEGELDYVISNAKQWLRTQL